MSKQLAGLVELLGLLVGVVGCGAVVGAAATVSTPLAVLAAGVVLVFAGIIAIYLAAVLDSSSRPSVEAPAG